MIPLVLSLSAAIRSDSDKARYRISLTDYVALSSLAIQGPNGMDSVLRPELLILLNGLTIGLALPNVQNLYNDQPVQIHEVHGGPSYSIVCSELETPLNLPEF